MSTDQIKNMTLEQLENDHWESPTMHPTELTKTAFLLRKKKLGDLDSNGLRVLISQNIGLEYLVPIAIDKLMKNVLEDAIFYPGDLLLTVLMIDNYWAKNDLLRGRLVSILNNSKAEITNSKKINDDLKSELISSIEAFISSDS